MSDQYLALETYLLPLRDIFAEKGINEVIINKPYEVWVENKGLFRKEIIKELEIDHLLGLGRLIAQSTNQIISDEKPLLSATLPNGYRIQVIFPPASEVGTVAMSIRKPNEVELSLDDYKKMGFFDQIITGSSEERESINKTLNTYLKNGQGKEFLEFAVISKKNIVISGGTSSGKTTFLNSALSVINSNERIITIEDAREVKLPNHPNRVHLIASKGGQGMANVTTESLIEACLRLRPDRIIVGELRGSEAFSFLRAINTGHPGSICSMHADTPEMAIEQLKLMVMQASLGLPSDEIKKYIMNVVDIIVQLKKGGGKRYISDIYFKDRTS
jgi:type IV secretion system protein VirB11